MFSLPARGLALALASQTLAWLSQRGASAGLPSPTHSLSAAQRDDTHTHYRTARCRSYSTTDRDRDREDRL